MELTFASITILIEDLSSLPRVNTMLEAVADKVLAKTQYPHRERSLQVTAIIVETTKGDIESLVRSMIRLPGVSICSQVAQEKPPPVNHIIFLDKTTYVTGTRIEITLIGQPPLVVVSTDWVIHMFTQGAPYGEGTPDHMWGTRVPGYSPFSTTAPLKPGIYEMRLNSQIYGADESNELDRVSFTVVSPPDGAMLSLDKNSYAPRGRMTITMHAVTPIPSALCICRQGGPYGAPVSPPITLVTVRDPITTLAPPEPGEYEVRLHSVPRDFNESNLLYVVTFPVLRAGPGK